jgi:hypothetical protein
MVLWSLDGFLDDCRLWTTGHLQSGFVKANNASYTD